MMKKPLLSVYTYQLTSERRLPTCQMVDFHRDYKELGADGKFPFADVSAPLEMPMLGSSISSLKGWVSK